MAKWLPLWLAKNYAVLWFSKGKEKVGFEEAVKLLKVSHAMVAKTLSQLEKRGALIKTRKEIDPRIKEYQLIPPEKLFLAHLRYLTLPTRPTLEDKLRASNLQYAATGSSASTYYQTYVYPPKVIEIKVKSEDLEEWVAYLSDERTRVCIEEVYERGQRIVKLIPTPPSITIKSVITKDGINIEPINKVIFQLLKNQTITDLRALGAILFKNRMEIDWRSLAEEGDKEFDNSKFCSQLGCFMDLLNKYARRIFSKAVLDIFKKRIKGFEGVFISDGTLVTKYNETINKHGRISSLPPSEQEKVKREMARFEHFKKFGEEWNLTIILPREEIEKIVGDLGI